VSEDHIGEADEKVVRLSPHLTTVGPGYKFDVDEVLEGAKGQGLEQVVIVGVQPNGMPWVSSAQNLAETVVLLERAKHWLLHE
jgi:hypothetical protein